MATALKDLINRPSLEFDAVANIILLGEAIRRAEESRIGDGSNITHPHPARPSWESPVG